MMFLYLNLLIMNTFLLRSSAYIFTSVQKTKEMVIVERKLIGELGNYILEAANDGEQVPDEIIAFYNQSSIRNKMAMDSQSFIENPLNSFHFMKRLHEGWRWLVSSLSLDEPVEYGPLKGLKEQLIVMEVEDGYSLSNTESDLNGAYTGIERLRKAYQLDIPELIQILDEQSEPLTLVDVFGICQMLDEKDEFLEMVQWLQGLRSTLADDSPHLSKIVRQLASALWKMDHHHQALSLLTEQQKTDPTNKRLQMDVDFYTNKQKGVQQTDKALSLTEEPPGVYEILCQGKGERAIDITSQLKCIYRPTVIPIYVAKEEILSIDPRISIVYNVTYVSEQDAMKRFASAKMKDSTVTNPDGSMHVATVYRVSQTAWFEDRDREVFRTISERVQLITGLSTHFTDIKTSHAEPLQVVNYGLGGMYVPHIDVLNTSALERQGDIRGDRLATWMFYLNDVKAGGATVFTVLNITVPVTKGAAAFWYNVERNGKKDERLSHAGCPVLLGSKWVANKWIREGGQVFRRKCGLSYNSIDGLFDSTTR